MDSQFKQKKIKTLWGKRGEEKGLREDIKNIIRYFSVHKGRTFPLEVTFKNT